jgi:hypothetical protein
MLALVLSVLAIGATREPGSGPLPGSVIKVKDIYSGTCENLGAFDFASYAGFSVSGACLSWGEGLEGGVELLDDCAFSGQAYFVQNGDPNCAQGANGVVSSCFTDTEFNYVTVVCCYTVGQGPPDDTTPLCPLK